MRHNTIQLICRTFNNYSPKINWIYFKHTKYSFERPSFSNQKWMDKLNRDGSNEDPNSVSSVEKELLGLERSDQIDINNDPRTQPDFPETRVRGARHSSDKYQTKSKTRSEYDNKTKNAYNRTYIEKKHGEYGWSPHNSKTADQWNWKDNNREYRNISKEEKENWPNELTLTGSGSGSGGGKYCNPNDLTTFESFSESARSATFRAALNVGVHWGKEVKLFNRSMQPYLKGVINGRHIFDLTLTISNLRKLIRLFQSLIMDECVILFVCNSRDVEMRTLGRIMSTRCGVPLLDDKWQPGSLSNWDHMAEYYRGPGRELTDGKRPATKEWRKTKLHRMIDSPPDFIFLLNRDYNDICVHEANRMQIPIASLCDSDDSTRDLQYVIPCNTQSLQSVHFILDMLTRGILEAKSKMDSLWWAKQKDLDVDRNALFDAEIEWQNKYDPYQQQRISSKMIGGSDDDGEYDIVTNYIKDDEDVILDSQTRVNENISLTKFGNVHIGTDHAQQNLNVSGGGLGTKLDDFGFSDQIEQSRKDKLQSVLDNRSTEYERKYNEKTIDKESDENKQYIKKFGLPGQFQTTSDFALNMLTDHVSNEVKNRHKFSNVKLKSK